MNQSRFKSITAWLSLVPIIIILGDTYNLWDIIHMPKDTFTQLITTIGAALNAFGAFNNPTKKGEF